MNCEYPFMKPHLRPRKANAITRMQGLDQFLRKCYVLGADIFYRMGFLPEQFIAQGNDLHNTNI
jgi:hypothetical protein